MASLKRSVHAARSCMSGARGRTPKARWADVPERHLLVLEESPALIPLVQSGRLRPERYISHRLPLSAGAVAHAQFDRREAGTLKQVLVPG